MSGPLVYIEYISRRPGVSLEAFHATQKNLVTLVDYTLVPEMAIVDPTLAPGARVEGVAGLAEIGMGRAGHTERYSQISGIPRAVHGDPPFARLRRLFAAHGQGRFAGRYGAE